MLSCSVFSLLSQINDEATQSLNPSVFLWFLVRWTRGCKKPQGVTALSPNCRGQINTSVTDQSLPGSNSSWESGSYNFCNQLTRTRPGSLRAGQHCKGREEVDCSFHPFETEAPVQGMATSSCCSSLRTFPGWVGRAGGYCQEGSATYRPPYSHSLSEGSPGVRDEATAVLFRVVPANLMRNSSEVAASNCLFPIATSPGPLLYFLEGVLSIPSSSAAESGNPPWRVLDEEGVEFRVHVWRPR